MFKFLSSTPARIVSILLIMQGGFLYSSIRTEFIPQSRPLSGVPRTLGAWQFAQEGVVDKETMDVLRADDVMNRSYRNGNVEANLFVAGFRSQRTGKAPHSPKNCLPGSGWMELSSGEISIPVGLSQPITVNRYVISHGDDRSLVLYWYQSRDRAVASEYKAKFWVVADAIRFNRTDTALVRVILPIVNRNEDEAEKRATQFVQSFYTTLLDYLPQTASPPETAAAPGL
ncbi:MAG: exosortase C-terminal domain/associated protein EpsI [Acidobacteriota bacterium]